MDTNLGKPVKTYIHHLCVDTGCRQENLPRAMANWDGWRGRFKGILDGDESKICVFCSPIHKFSFYLFFSAIDKRFSSQQKKIAFLEKKNYPGF